MFRKFFKKILAKDLIKRDKMCIMRVFFKKERKKIYGEMAERSKAAVLKTVDVKASWGSNPYLSANFIYCIVTL